MGKTWFEARDLIRRFVAGQAAGVCGESCGHTVVWLLPIVARRASSRFMRDFHPDRASRNTLKRHRVAIVAGKSGGPGCRLLSLYGKMPQMRKCDGIHAVQLDNNVNSGHLLSSGIAVQGEADGRQDAKGAEGRNKLCCLAPPCDPQVFSVKSFFHTGYFPVGVAPWTLSMSFLAPISASYRACPTSRNFPTSMVCASTGSFL